MASGHRRGYHWPMLNYRLVTALLLLGTILVPLAFHWATVPTGNWFRPFVIWGMLVFATYLMQRHGIRDDK